MSKPLPPDAQKRMEDLNPYSKSHGSIPEEMMSESWDEGFQSGFNDPAHGEMLTEMEFYLLMISSNIVRPDKYYHWTPVDIAKEALEKLRARNK